MLNIYICEDEAPQRDFLQKLISSNQNIQNSNTSFVGAYESPADLINLLNKQQTNDIGLYFLDIDLNSEMDGFELATYIRKHDPRGFIVIVTTHSEMLPLTFEYMIEPLGYIIKGSSTEMKKQLNACIDKAIYRYGILIELAKNNKTIKFNRGTKNYYINTDTIQHITCSHIPHVIEVFTVDSIIQPRGNISELVKLLPSNFMQISRETIVNLNFIKEVDKENHELILQNNATFNISWRKQNELIKAIGKKK